MIVRLENVWKVYNLGKTKVVALKEVSLKIREGEFVSIMGPSGSGKSTLLHLIGCLDKPTKGKVYIFGKDISKLNDNQLAKIRNKKIGFVFQMFYLIPTLTAIENVELPMVFAGVPKKKRVKRAKRLLEWVSLGDRLYHKPSELSGGQQQRVAIARALANDPDLILADEPTGALDVESAKTVMDLFKKLHRDGKTIIIVTHDPKVASYAERIIVIKGGKIIANGISIDEAVELLKK